MNSGVRLLGKFTLMTYTIPAGLVMSVLFKISLMSVVIAVVPMGNTQFMVVGVAMMPMVNGKLCPLVTMLAIPLVTGITIVWTMS